MPRKSQDDNSAEDVELLKEVARCAVYVAIAVGRAIKADSGETSESEADIAAANAEVLVDKLVEFAG